MTSLAETEKTYSRVRSLDILRGAVMAIMAIDHVRVYSGIPAGSHDPAIFFTRWITHFCAPAFVFFAGTAAYLYGKKSGDISKLSGFLSLRGCILVLLEITLIRFLWSFNLDFSQFFLAGVIWMLGWCMVILSFLVRFKAKTIGLAGLAIILFQQAFKLIPHALPVSLQLSFGKFWEFIYPSGMQGIEEVSILYVLVPWIGVMMAGYGLGLILEMDIEKRDRICNRTGLAAIALFLIIGSIVILRSPAPDHPIPFWMRLLNQNKYPASQLFLFMTLGPVVLLIPYAERAKGWLANVLALLGRVPMFFYLLHILLIHLSALIVNYFKEGNVHSDWYLTAPFTYLPDEFRWSLPLLYLVYLTDVVLLYFACKWYATIKAANPDGWTRYI